MLMNKDMQHYGEKLKILRAMNALTQSERGEKTGKVPGRTISSWARSQVPPLEGIIAMCRIIQIPLSDFFNEGNNYRFQRKLIKSKMNELIEMLEKKEERVFDGHLLKLISAKNECLTMMNRVKIKTKLSKRGD